MILFNECSWLLTELNGISLNVYRGKRHSLGTNKSYCVVKIKIMRTVVVKPQKLIDNAPLQWHPVPSLHDKYMGKQWKQWETLFFGTPKSLQMVTVAMKLKMLAPWKKNYEQFSESESLSHSVMSTSFVTPWTIQSMEFFRPEYWSG